MRQAALRLRNQQKVVYQSLKQRIYVNTQDDAFVQCVSPNLYNFLEMKPTPMLNQIQGKDWDVKTDVIVIGSGFAGLAAAIEAKNAGASVLVLEKRSACGGNSIMSDGGMAVASSSLQKRQSIKDSPELMYQDMLKAGLNLNESSLAKIVAQNSNSTLEWLINSLGVQFQDKLVAVGGHFVPRTYIPYNTSGTAIVKPLLAKAKELGITIRVKTCLTKFIQSADGRVEGVEIYDSSQDKVESIYANGGVVLATGGFGGDVPFRTLQDSRLTEDVGNTNRSETTAEAMIEAIKIGANSVHLQWIQLSPWSSPDEKIDKIASEFFYTVFPYGIVINPITGKRMVNELADRKTRSDAILNVGKPCIGIADLAGTYTSGHKVDKYLNRDIINIFKNLEELATAYNLHDQALKETIHRYNNYVENFQDEEFQKPIPIDAKPLHPPYYAMRLWPKVHYTMGGLKINTKAQVIDINNQPIPNFYAAGEVTGGIHGASRLGGCSVTECLVFGRIAGINAALEVFWKSTNTKNINK